MTRLSTHSTKYWFATHDLLPMRKVSTKRKRSKLACAMWSFTHMEFSKDLHCRCKMLAVHEESQTIPEPFLGAIYPRML